ncbi:hypothetical protein PDESU_00569 [Pontiella desulfatans]|uniref:Uncharacterized protein n=1 Tax=Pontiella desulfatans TaxID=2750659 RepID=A0A6C2TXF7_PONDE|nr:hypothetical protein [Pontiella desulfatans]VGO12021.1 hypothetical protein PDESU_00569 [Pontiella desulfatans]
MKTAWKTVTRRSSMIALSIGLVFMLTGCGGDDDGGERDLSGTFWVNNDDPYFEVAFNGYGDRILIDFFTQKFTVSGVCTKVSGGVSFYYSQIWSGMDYYSEGSATVNGDTLTLNITTTADGVIDERFTGTFIFKFRGEYEHY